jgi:FAD synthase
MRATLYGKIVGPAIAVVGVWDPLLHAHQELFERVYCQARRNGLTSLAIVIDPDPALVMRGAAKWPVFDDVRTRIQRLRSAGIDAILHLRFVQDDLNAGVAEFFALVEAHATLAELWLGAHQTIGRGPNGSQQAILEAAEQRGIQLYRLPIVKLLPPPYEIRQSLAAGRVAEVVSWVGRAPIRSRPRSDTRRLAWCPGRYRALPLASLTAPTTEAPLEIELVDRPRGLPTFQWPHRDIKYLAFVAGPADQC